MRRLALILLILLLLAACRPVAIVVTTTPDGTTPTQEATTWTPEPTRYSRDCRLPPAQFEILNPNPCLDNPIMTEYQEDITEGITVQYRPETYSIYQLHENAFGLSGDEHHTFPIPIEYDDGYVFGVGFVAGEVGYETNVTVHEATCLSIQAFGNYRIEDTEYAEHRNNYAMQATITRQDGAEVKLGMVLLPEMTGANIDPFWTVRVTEPGAFMVRLVIDIGYATAPAGSWVRVESISVAITPGGYCDNEFTPVV